MKASYHKEDNNLRIIQRGSLFHCQRRDEIKGTRTFDPWYDIGQPHDLPSAAGAAMYSIRPLTNTSKK